MTDDEDQTERAKVLIGSNCRESRVLFGRPDAPAIQLPAGDGQNRTVDLGIQPIYRRNSLLSRKRPRVSDQQVGATRETHNVGQRLNDATSGSVTQAVSRLVNGDIRQADSAPKKDPPEHGGAESPTPKVNILKENSDSLALVRREEAHEGLVGLTAGDKELAIALSRDRPAWRAPWKMFRGISGHLGWVRSVAVDTTNEWFATGSADRTVKIWDLASGRLKLTLTGHISTVRGIAISPRHPYMFTVGEDKTVKCWDLEQNKVIRNYHGHLSGVYCVSLHPTLDVLMTGGRDSTIRVWDIRTRAQVFVLGGHRDTINAVITQSVDPQIISASVDSTIRTWDLAAGKCSATLTNHKKGVRALVRHPREFSFASASADNIKTWALPDGTFMRNLSGQHHEKLVNALAVNDDGVLASGGDDGSLCFWDYSGAHCFQSEQTVVQPGSLDCEAGIYAMAFDKSGSRLITCEADKTIKMWKEDTSATPETHPLDWKPNMQPKRY